MGWGPASALGTADPPVLLDRAEAGHGAAEVDLAHDPHDEVLALVVVHLLQLSHLIGRGVDVGGPGERTEWVVDERVAERRVRHRASPDVGADGHPRAV